MTGLRVYLWASAAVWLPYGIFCFFQPGALNEFAGLAASTATANTELRAMYGGLQAGIGSLSLLAALRPAWVRPALVVLAFLSCGLAIGRLGGVVFDGGLSAYTGSALAFEITSSSCALFFLSRAAPPTPA